MEIYSMEIFIARYAAIKAILAIKEYYLIFQVNVLLSRNNI